jgi:outer membrane immunogenic protein
MRKAMLLASAAALGATFLAPPAVALDDAFSDFYVGGFGQYSAYEVDLTTGGGTGDLSADGFGGGGLIGFGIRKDFLYGGIEAEVGYDGADRSEPIPGGTASIEAQLSGGVGLRFGIAFEERFLPFVRVGWQLTEYKASVTGLGSGTGALNGLRVGGGLEFLLSDSVSIRGEYAHTWYEEYDDVAGLSVEPSQHLFRLGAAFHF